MDASLIIPAFIAGILTFLAPCTLPLVPGYLSFISGVSAQDLNNPLTRSQARRKIFLNGLLYVIGFSLVFIILGSLFGLGGAALIKYRLWLSRIGGSICDLFWSLHAWNSQIAVFSVFRRGKTRGRRMAQARRAGEFFAVWFCLCLWLDPVRRADFGSYLDVGSHFRDSWARCGSFGHIFRWARHSVSPHCRRDRVGRGDFNKNQ